jgi:hypothetical protein
VRGHHQKTHVVDDILGREQRAVLMGGATELREKILAAAGAADRNLLGKIGDDAGAAFDAARHLRARPGSADRGDRCGDHIDERLRDLLDVGSDPRAEKRGGREIERELLHGRVEQHRAGSLPPLRDALADAGIERRKIGPHRTGFERYRQRPPVQAMLLEIEQHQAARKQPAENRPPAMGRGKQPGLIEQHELVGFRSECGNAGFAEYPGAIDEAVFRAHPLDFPLGVGEDCQRPADDRPAFVTGNVRQRMAFGWPKRNCGGSHTLQGHGDCSVGPQFC